VPNRADTCAGCVSVAAGELSHLFCGVRIGHLAIGPSEGWLVKLKTAVTGTLTSTNNR
jgi:hypothetical protein